jgi:hypothetical protein
MLITAGCLFYIAKCIYVTWALFQPETCSYFCWSDNFCSNSGSAQCNNKGYAGLLCGMILDIILIIGFLTAGAFFEMMALCGCPTDLFKFGRDTYFTYYISAICFLPFTIPSFGLVLYDLTHHINNIPSCVLAAYILQFVATGACVFIISIFTVGYLIRCCIKF